MTLVFTKGATAYGFQIGRLYGRFLRRPHWCWANLPHAIKFGWDNTNTTGDSE